MTIERKEDCEEFVPESYCPKCNRYSLCFFDGIINDYEECIAKECDYYQKPAITEKMGCRDHLRLVK